MNKLIVPLLTLVGMLGTTAAITSLSGIQEASAQGCGPTFKNCFCYSSFSGTACFENKGDCNKAQKNDLGATSRCFKQG